MQGVPQSIVHWSYSRCTSDLFPVVTCQPRSFMHAPSERHDTHKRPRLIR